MQDRYDVLVVGAGNAALCAALAAREAGVSVLVLERAPIKERGGNTAFTAGAMRFAYDGTDEILQLVPDLTDEQVRTTDFGTYPVATFYDDLARVTEYRTDPELADYLVRESFETLKWMKSKGVRFMPIYGRQAFNVDGMFTFWGGLVLETWGGGPGLIETLVKAADQVGVEIAYSTRAVSLLTDGHAVVGVEIDTPDGRRSVAAGAIVLACGGFEANPEWRARYLGPGWDLAKVRGSRHNMGDGIKMALDIGAMPWGHWSGSHAVGWELNAPPFGDLRVGDGFQKHSYPFGIMVNADGHRFIDEGADFRNYTYAKYGAVILRQPQGFAWQIFDQKVAHLLRDEYRIREVTKASAETLPELASLLDGVDQQQLLRTIQEYNESITTGRPFNPNIKDGRCTVGLDVDKSNWANTLDTPPFQAYAVTCGITFTFGGLHVNTRAEVLDTNEVAINGLFACGELVGGVFYHNYPGGSGLTSGAVFGRAAGTQAAKCAMVPSSASRSGSL